MWFFGEPFPAHFFRPIFPADLPAIFLADFLSVLPGHGFGSRAGQISIWHKTIATETSMAGVPVNAMGPSHLMDLRTVPAGDQNKESNKQISKFRMCARGRQRHTACHKLPTKWFAWTAGTPRMMYKKLGERGARCARPFWWELFCALCVQN